MGNPRCETIQSAPTAVVRWQYIGTFSGKWISASGTEYKGKGKKIDIEGIYIPDLDTNGIFCNITQQLMASLQGDSVRVNIEDVRRAAEKKFKKLYSDQEELKTNFHEFEQCLLTMDPDGDGIDISDIVEAVEMKMLRKKMLED